jgi:DNA-binding transcriptional regulator YiaG
MNGRYADFLARKQRRPQAAADLLAYAAFLQDGAAMPPRETVVFDAIGGYLLGPSLKEFRAAYNLKPGDGTCYVYALYDPRTLELRYVGKSIRPAERLTNEMNERSDTHRCHWLQELRSLGLRPIQVILDAVPGEWQTVERAYIAGARACTTRLTNATDGGDGVEGLSEESRAKMRATWLGRKHRAESLAKMAASSRMRRHTPEWRQYMRGLMQGREFTPEHRQKIRAAIQKLSPDQVREIRALLRDHVSQYVIADRFGVHQGSISNIARGLTYRDVPDA